MIPKIIHYCWFGGNPLPPLALECIASWRKFLPDYEIWQWGEGTPSNFPKGDEPLVADKLMAFDVHSIPYTAEAYRQKKFAFVSDYCRFVAMYEYGGIYFDTDVEVIRPMNEIIAKGNFMGFEVDPDGENTPGRYAPRYCFDVNPGLGFGMTAKHPFIKKMVEYYQNLKFVIFDSNEYNKGTFSFLNPFQKKENRVYFKTIVAYTTELLMNEIPPLTPPKKRKGILHWFRPQKYTDIQVVGDNIYVYPHDYFAPIDVITGKLHITESTYTIHRYMSSWLQTNRTWKNYLRDFIPNWVFYLNNKLKKHNYRI